MKPSRWHLELWSRDGVLLADLAGRARNRRIVESRNEAEDIYWQLDLAEFERYARLLKTTSTSLLVPGQTEVRIRRGQKYLCGGQVVYRNPRITPQSQDIELRATGFLNMLADRYTDENRVFSSTNAPTMYSTLVTESQDGGDDWDFGITIGTVPTANSHDKSFKSQNLKEAMQRGTELFDHDFKFTHDKVLNFYAPLGSQRPDIIFEYPGGNIRSLTSPLDATNIKNRIYVLGSGSGEDGNATATVDDPGTSQTDYKVREERISFSEVEDETDLENHGHRETAAWAVPFEIPQPIVSGNMKPYVTDYGVGDWVKVRILKYDMFQREAMYRVEKREIVIDEEDNEEVTLYLSR